jgi:hypothetical protein
VGLVGLEVQAAVDLDFSELANKKPPLGGFLFSLNLLDWGYISFWPLTRHYWGVKLKLNFAISINIDIYMTTLRQFTEQQFIGKCFAYRVLNDSLHWSCTHERIKAVFS